MFHIPAHKNTVNPAGQITEFNPLPSLTPATEAEVQAELAAIDHEAQAREFDRVAARHGGIVATASRSYAAFHRAKAAQLRNRR